jgi:glycosyltransferase involved in cell wall biosynthesis
MKPLFTISIPTFNRAEILRHTLSQVCTLASLYSHQTGQEIEVLCIDNASTDNTQEVVHSFKSKFGFVRYIRNEKNIGLIMNIRKAIISASSEYVWTLGDDDYPSPWCMDAVSKAIAYAGTHCPDTAFILFAMAYTNPELMLVSQRRKSQYTKYSPGCSILSDETIHGIALISRWLFVKANWDDDYFLKSYRESDIYTFLKVIIQSSLVKTGLFVASPIAIASDRGSRSYYHPKTAIARVSEFPEIENIVLDRYGMRRGRRMITAERKNWLHDRLMFIVKLNTFRNEYSSIQCYLESPISRFPAQRLLIKAIRVLTSISPVRSFLCQSYMDSKILKSPTEPLDSKP